MSNLIFSLDLGTTNLKSALFDSKLNILGSSHVPIEYLTSEGNKFIEFNPSVFWELILQLINKTCKEANLNLGSINIIAITSQANTFLVMPENGKVKSNFISYLDERAIEEADILNEKFGKDFNLHSSFSKATESLLISKLLWFKNNKTGLITDEDTFSSLPGYIAFKLTSVNSIDVNIAAMEGLYSLKDKIWRQDLANFVGMNYKNFPKIITAGNYLTPEKGNTNYFLNKNLKVFLTGNDQTVGAFGNSLKEGEIIIGLGTSLVIYKNQGKSYGPFNKNTGWGPYPFEEFYELYASNYGSYALDMVMEKLLFKKDVENFKNLAINSRFLKDRNNIKNEDRIFFYPDKVNLNKEWYGINNNIQDKAYSVFEGLSFFIKYIFEDIFNIKNNINYVYVSGGGSENILWLHLIADILNLKVIKTNSDSLLGAAMIALKSLGVVNFKKSLLKEKDKLIIYPEKGNVGFYKELYKLWISHK